MKRVIVVDDDPMQRLIMSRDLCEHGYDVEAHPCAEDAYASVLRGGVDAVITDLRLGGMDGLTLGRMILGNEATKHIKVIVVSGSMPPSQGGPTGFSCHAYFTKPVDIRRLQTKMTELLEGKS